VGWLVEDTRCGGVQRWLGRRCVRDSDAEAGGTEEPPSGQVSVKANGELSIKKKANGERSDSSSCTYHYHANTIPARELHTHVVVADCNCKRHHGPFVVRVSCRLQWHPTGAVLAAAHHGPFVVPGQAPTPSVP
jgi:hypothetical protein